MANNEIAVRFTEEKYATKSEVSRELKTTIVDTFWNNIKAYRSNFNQYLPIKSIDKNMLVFCACPSIVGLVNNLDNKFIRVNREFSHLSSENGDLNRFTTQCFITSLKYIAKKHSIEVDDEYLRSLVQGDIKQVSPSSMILVRYLDCLRYIQKSFVNPIDEDFLGTLYSKINGTDELTSFYRVSEDKNPDNRVIIDRIYTCAPVQSIDWMMASLFTFVSSNSISSSTKALSTYYYVNYIRPFSNYSDEISILLAKAVLAHDSIGELAAYLPIEFFLSENIEEVNKISIEVQKTNDITYFVNLSAKLVDKKCDLLLDKMANISKEALRKDFYREDDKVEEVKITHVEPKIIKPSTTKVEKEIEEIPPEKITYKKEELAISYIPPAIDEKEANRLEQHLLESDPSMRKGEAKFYARHCVKGKKYTIQQYKKAIGCVYETARTSMDHLVELGYYRKDKIKNKFVYTPIPH